jgi:hypothetical protein
MFERHSWIARSIFLSLLVMPFLIDACALEASAQSTQPVPPSQQIQAPSNLAASAGSSGSTTQRKSAAKRILACILSVIAMTGVAPILAAIIAGCFGWAIAQFYTKQLKQIEAALDFSKRFHELIQQQRVLNRKYDEARLKCKVERAVNKLDKQDADAWWWRFFDLLQYEYDFYQKGMVRKARFEEWMVWRWHDFHPEEGKEWKTCGIEYSEAWATWTKHPAQPSRLIKLLTEIHEIRVPPNLAAKERNKVLAKLVRKKVRRHGPRLWRLTELERAFRYRE